MAQDRSGKLTTALGNIKGVMAVRVNFDGDRTYTVKIAHSPAARHEVKDITDLFANNFHVRVKVTGF